MSEKTPDFGALPAYVGYNLRRAQTASFRHLDEAVQTLGLSPGQFSLLVFLHVNPGMNQSEIARVFNLDKSTLSPVLDGLAKRGLVARRRSHKDRRAYQVELTAEGTNLMRRMKAEIEAQEALIDSALAPGEREKLLDMLQRIAVKLNA